jgi:hypothetical protein
MVARWVLFYNAHDYVMDEVLFPSHSISPILRRVWYYGGTGVQV